MTNSLRLFRALCPALDNVTDDRVTLMLTIVPDLHPELSVANYGSSLNEAIVMMAAHRIASENQYLLGSQVAIAKGETIYPESGGDWLSTTPYGQRASALRCQSVATGAIAMPSFDLDFAWYDY